MAGKYSQPFEQWNSLKRGRKLFVNNWLEIPTRLIYWIIKCYNVQCETPAIIINVVPSFFTDFNNKQVLDGMEPLVYKFWNSLSPNTKIICFNDQVINFMRRNKLKIYYVNIICFNIEKVVK